MMKLKISHLILGFCLCAGGIIAAEQDVLFDFGKQQLWPNKKQMTFKRLNEKAPDGSAVGEVVTLGEPTKKSHEVQLNFTTERDIKKGDIYIYSFYVKADKPGKFQAALIQNCPPWKGLGEFWKTVNLKPEWQKISVKGKAALDHNGKISLMLSMGHLPKGIRVQFGKVELKKIAIDKNALFDFGEKNFYPNKKQLVFRRTDETAPDGSTAAEFTTLLEPQAKMHAVQLTFRTNKEIVKGDIYKYSFYIKADRDGKITSTFNQECPPWKGIGEFWKNIMVNKDWQLVTVEAKAAIDHKGPVGVSLFLGHLPKGTKVYVGKVLLKKKSPSSP